MATNIADVISFAEGIKTGINKAIESCSPEHIFDVLKTIKASCRASPYANEPENFLSRKALDNVSNYPIWCTNFEEYKCITIFLVNHNDAAPSTDSLIKQFSSYANGKNEALFDRDQEKYYLNAGKKAIGIVV